MQVLLLNYKKGKSSYGHEQTFSKLKQLLMTDSILKVSYMDQNVLVCIDASKEGLGFMLVYEGRLISYASRRLRSHEEKHMTRDLELAEIIYVLWLWRHYLVGRKFELKIDHHGLQYIFR